LGEDEEWEEEWKEGEKRGKEFMRSREKRGGDLSRPFKAN